MLIISQDKGKIINFDNITQVYITQYEEKTACFIRFETVDSLCDGLGEYKTKERAKEVLQEIIKAYKETNYEYENCWCLRNVIYEMPAN